MKYIYTIAITLLTSLMWGCSDDQLPGMEAIDGADLPRVDAYLSLSISDFSVSSDGSRAEEPDDQVSEIEKKIENTINDIWIFQFTSDGQKHGNPQHIAISDQAELSKLHVTLATGNSLYLYVVANTGDESWAAGIQKLGDLQNKAISSPTPIMVAETNPRCLPMEGCIQTNVTEGMVIRLSVSRMYAKLRISFGHLEEGLSPYSVEINNIPNYCRVQTLGGNGESAGIYDTGTEWVTRSFKSNTSSVEGEEPKKEEYVIYIPENLQGEVNNQENKGKNEIAPTNALVIKLNAKYKYYEDVPNSGYKVELEEERYYTVYPGGNTSNNFNIKRNHVYRVRANVYTTEQDTPSANCFVVKPGKTMAFEPYYRTEIGGGYNIRTYLDPQVEDKSIDNVQILWQTKDAIGNNSSQVDKVENEGRKVWFKYNADKPEHSKIIVRTKKTGNALIGAFNKKGEIIWSWHIWIRDNDPSNVGSAIVYSTFSWNNTKINNNQNERIPGYAIMPCNLGALVDEPASNKWDDITQTFGMLYQWGRKDPFPPLIKQTSPEEAYTNVLAGVHYDYTNNNTVGKKGDVGVPQSGSASDPKVSFFSVIGKSVDKSILFSIRNPLVFICGSNSVTYNLTTCNSPDNNFNKGDWIKSDQSDDKLWGGKKPVFSNEMKYLKVVEGSGNVSDMYIFDNYGTEKSIFDPCPKGWRVPPGDLWLGFSKTGKNPTVIGDINYDNVKTQSFIPAKVNNTDFSGGMFLYMQGFRNGPTLYFPTQGPRIASGRGMRVGICGNYHNATATTENRVNILHIHNLAGTFKIFETSNYGYIVKSVAGPIRCVRDTK